MARGGAQPVEMYSHPFAEFVARVGVPAAIAIIVLVQLHNDLNRVSEQHELLTRAVYTLSYSCSSSPPRSPLGPGV